MTGLFDWHRTSRPTGRKENAKTLEMNVTIFYRANKIGKKCFSKPPACALKETLRGIRDTDLSCLYSGMALLAYNSRQIAYRGLSLPNAWVLYLLTGHRKSTNVDAIDSFISELVENKTLKWKVLSHNKKVTKTNGTVASELAVPASGNSSFKLTQIFDDLTSNPIVINIDLLEQQHVDNLVETAIKEGNQKDVHLLFEQMDQYRKLPSKTVLNMLLENFAKNVDRLRLVRLMELCRRVDADFVSTNGDLLHYKALLQWKSGSSLNALNSFKDALRSCTSNATKEVINRMLKEIVDETIGKKSEAVLLAVIEMGEFCMLQLHDEYLLCYSWEKSFRSQWYSDQEVAKTIFNKHNDLRLAIAKRLSKICFIYLQEYCIEQVYQLMELFLKHNMLIQCRLILIRLFEYQYWRRDLRACSEIIQNSIDLNIPLPEVYNRKLLDLLFNGTGYQQSSPTVNGTVQKAKNYEFKF
ncbi:uncharacterized protein LOC129725773 [Wyeomyia smithii]|uniref:uncharacterized protein LOC129725773 n=1 Tax=Wyeomyia smithii TaxID=174621 RepID=UPI002468010E|nr:uncharacterized protein LOC129725773 [Wyeomyia smithii]